MEEHGTYHNDACHTAGELSEQPLEEVQKQINTYAIPHFLLFKHFAPLLKDDDASSFTFISGAGGVLTDCQAFAQVQLGLT